MRVRAWACTAVLPLALALSGCGPLPGYPRAGPPIPPDQILDFQTLYKTNCQACHGVNGANGPAMDLANPEYEALVDDATLRKIISDGMPGTQMPAWAQSAGGMLTDRQIDAIVAGMRKQWAKPNAFAGTTPPPLAQNQAGDVHRGQQAYQERCAMCHQGPARQQITSPVYLSLVSDEALRSIMIAGRPDIGQPDWRLEPVPGNWGPAVKDSSSLQPLSDQNVTDIVTYLHSLRNPAAVSAAPIQPRR